MHQAVDAGRQRRPRAANAVISTGHGRKPSYCVKPQLSAVRGENVYRAAIVLAGAPMRSSVGTSHLPPCAQAT